MRLGGEIHKKETPPACAWPGVFRWVVLLGLLVLAAVKQLTNNGAKHPDGEHQQIQADEADLPAHDDELVTPLQGLHHAFTGGDALKEHQVDSEKESVDFDSHDGCHEDGVEDVEHRQYEMTPSLVKRGFTCHT